MTDLQTPESNEPVSAGTADEALLAKFNEPAPEAWIAKNSGDTLTGAFLRLERVTTLHGPSMVVVVGTSDGERSFFLFYESAKTAFRRARPEPGEMIAIRYNGELPVKNPTPGHKATYHDYQVVVDRPIAAGSVDWETALPDDAA